MELNRSFKFFYSSLYFYFVCLHGLLFQSLICIVRKRIMGRVSNNVPSTDRTTDEREYRVICLWILLVNMLVTLSSDRTTGQKQGRSINQWMLNNRGQLNSCNLINATRIAGIRLHANIVGSTYNGWLYSIVWHN